VLKRWESSFVRGLTHSWIKGAKQAGICQLALKSLGMIITHWLEISVQQSVWSWHMNTTEDKKGLALEYMSQALLVKTKQLDEADSQLASFLVESSERKNARSLKLMHGVMKKWMSIAVRSVISTWYKHLMAAYQELAVAVTIEDAAKERAVWMLVMSLRRWDLGYVRRLLHNWNKGCALSASQLKVDALISARVSQPPVTNENRNSLIIMRQRGLKLLGLVLICWLEQTVQRRLWRWYVKAVLSFESPTEAKNTNMDVTTRPGKSTGGRSAERRKNSQDGSKQARRKKMEFGNVSESTSENNDDPLKLFRIMKKQLAMAVEAEGRAALRAMVANHQADKRGLHSIPLL